MIRSKDRFLDAIIEERLPSLPSYRYFMLETHNIVINTTQNGDKEISSEIGYDVKG